MKRSVLAIMKGLLLKDFYQLRRFGKIYAVILAIYTVVAIFVKNSGFIVGVNVSMFSILPFTTMSQDHGYHWTGYAFTTPVTRRTVAVEKYVMVLCVWAVGLAITLAIGAVTYLISPETFPWNETIGTVASLTAMIFVNNSITIPALLKFGPEKGRFFMMGALVIPMLGIVAVIEYIPAFMGMYGIVLGVIGILLLLFVSSMMLSVRICETMDES